MEARGGGACGLWAGRCGARRPPRAAAAVRLCCAGVPLPNSGQAAHLLSVDALDRVPQAQALQRQVPPWLQQLPDDAVRLFQVALEHQHAPAVPSLLVRERGAGHARADDHEVPHLRGAEACQPHAAPEGKRRYAIAGYRPALRPGESGGGASAACLWVPRSAVIRRNCRQNQLVLHIGVDLGPDDDGSLGLGRHASLSVVAENSRNKTSSR